MLWCSFMFGNLTPHVLSEWMVEVFRFEVCCGVLCFELVDGLTLGVILLLYTIIIYYILYYTYYTIIILHYILYLIYYTLLLLLFFSPLPISLLPPLPSFILFSLPSSSNPPHSFYTCRYLHILIYILPASLSRPSSSKSDPARSIGVDG